MTVSVPTLREGPRGCGYRKGGGIYLVSAGLGEPCERLPLPVVQCPTCGHGVKPARGFAWIDGEEFFGHIKHGTEQHDRRCPLGMRTSGQRVEGINGAPAIDIHLDGKDLTKSGILWIGEKFYPTVAHFTEEAARMGVSRRISQMPREFEVGKTWVFLGHRKSIMRIVDNKELGRGEVVFTPGVFRVFKPERAEYVVTGKETEEELEALVKRGLTPVAVERLDPTPEQVESGIVPTPDEVEIGDE